MTADRDAGAARPRRGATDSPSGIEPRERFVLDYAHVGDIQGAFGTISQHEEADHGLRARGWRCSRSWARD